MSIYSKVQSGTKVFRTRFSNKFQRVAGDINFGQLFPVYRSFVLPGDVFRLSYDLLIRMQPMRAPYLNRNTVTVRYFFVPLRLLDERTELIITGSYQGHYNQNDVIPEFPNIWEWYKERHPDENSVTVGKGSFADVFFGIPVGDYDISENGANSVLHDLSAPAAYWYKAFFRVWWDYYRDENLDYSSVTGNLSFDDWFDDVESLNVSGLGVFQENGMYEIISYAVKARKDYFTSALPWQLKGIAPTVPITVSSGFTVNQLQYRSTNQQIGVPLEFATGNPPYSMDYPPAGTAYIPDYKDSGQTSFVDKKKYIDAVNSFFSAGLSNAVAGAGFNADELRLMMAQTRIFERLARTGSRYTEYLRANFNTSPADGTLQRAQYLGGGKQDIVLTEVVQTAGATNDQGNETPVGTLRGHGISRGGHRLSRNHFSEFGVVIGVLDVRPERIYTTGVMREMTYRNRWDFFNPSFQHLSEQEVRNGEVYYGNDGQNDATFGFQGMYNELRSSQTMLFGDLRDNLSYWTQAYMPASRPHLNSGFLRGQQSDFQRPFDVTDVTLARPMILDFCTYNDAYRPMVREAVPGLVDHN